MITTLPSASARVAAIEKDRNDLTEPGVKAAAKLSISMLRSVVTAYKAGTDPTQTIRKMMEDYYSPILIDAMAAAELKGKQRTYITVEIYGRQAAAGLQMSSVYDNAIEKLKKRLKLSEAEIEALRESYTDPADDAVDDLADGVSRRVRATITESLAKGESVSDGVRGLKAAFEDEGLSPSAPYRLEALYRTSVQQAYSAGRWKAMNEPDIKPMIKGLQYCAIEDDRTTPLCEQLDGVVQPMDAEFWDKYMPPNHWSCRSTVLEVFGDEGIESTEIPEGLDEPDEGFDQNFGAETGQEMSNANRDDRGRFCFGISNNTADWLKHWSFGGASKGQFNTSVPPDQAIRELSSFRPTQPLTVYRAHLPGTKTGNNYESWTSEKGLAETIIEDDPRRILLSRIVKPSQVLVHTSMLPKELENHVIPGEVIVAYGGVADKMRGIRGESL